jgi:hypothetical protein
MAGASKGHAARRLKAAGLRIVESAVEKGWLSVPLPANPPAMRTLPLGNRVDE